ncbi:MAG: hypothetical protein Q4C12_06350 [Clostridia bacterium]|nr:hypothetical protein [Clostridia bacterium]
MNEIIINALPKTIEEFMAMPQIDLSLPQNTVAMFLIALDVFTQNRKLGTAMLNKLKGPIPLNASETAFLVDRIRDKQYLPMVYFVGATPKNNYTPQKPLTLHVYDDFRESPDEGYIRLFLETDGADAKRPITLRQKDDKWYLWEYSSILMGVRIPAKDDPWM